MPINEDAARIARHIGTRVQALRKARGLKQADLAPIYGVKHGQVSNYEKGTSLITLDNLYRIAAYFDVPLESLLPPLDSPPTSGGMAEDQAAFTRDGAAADNVVANAQALADLYLSIRDEDVRASLLQHARTLARLAG